jgi:multidrug efflux pump subunit AcrA (membrane-fusion protein)
MAQRAKARRSISRSAIFASLASWLLSIVTTAALVAVGWLGHATHWTFGLAGHDSPAGHAAHGGAVEPAEAVKPGSRVSFESREAVERTGIELVEVVERPVVTELLANGVVRYDERHTAQLSARASGSIWKVEKHLGDTVRKGEVLLIVESSEVGRLKAEFLNSLVAFEAKREQLAILEEVQSAVMGRQLREAKAALREARNHLINDEQALVNLGFEISTAAFADLEDDARAERIRLLGLDESILAGVHREGVTSNLMPLRAPFDGVVIGRDAVVGEVVEAGRPIFELADVSTMWVVLSVSKEDAAKVAIGQPVRFRPDGSTDEFLSRIAWISTEVNEETRTLEVRAEIENRPPGVAAAEVTTLRANTFGSGRIEIARRGTAVVVPRSSVQWDGSRWVVFVPTGETAFEPRPVQRGVEDGEFVEILGDFAADARPTHVVGTGSHVLKSQIMLERMEAGEL